jgi:hypothetical protein
MQKVILKHLRISRFLYTLPLFVPCNNSKNVYTECLRKTLGYVLFLSLICIRNLQDVSQHTDTRNLYSCHVIISPPSASTHPRLKIIINDTQH